MSSFRVLSDLALAAAERGELKKAVGLAREALRENPLSFDGWFQLGSYLRRSGSYEAARHAFRCSLELAPTDAGDLVPVAWTLRGLCAEKLWLLREAQWAYFRSLRLQPSADRYVLLGCVELRMGRYWKAEGLLNQALRLEPGKDEAMLNLAIVLEENRPSEAMALLRSTIEIDPRQPTAHAELGYLLMLDGQPDEAEHSLRRSLAIDVGQAWTHVYMAALMSGRPGCERKAIAALELAAELDRSAGPCLMLGDVYTDLGEQRLAESHYGQALLRRLPQEALGETDADFLARQDRIRQARAWLQRYARYAMRRHGDNRPCR